MNVRRSIFIIASIILIVFASYFALTQLANDETHSGEYLRATKVYMPNTNIKLAIYFNDSSESVTFLVFDGWSAKHSIQLSNMAEGTMIKIHYKEYLFGGLNEIVRIERV